MIEVWDQLPLVSDLPLLCDPYSKNYFHFSLEMAPRLRFFDRGDMVIMTPDSLKRPFQRDVITRVLSSKRVLPLQWGLRVRDPIVAHDSMSEEGVLWLREASRISGRPGRRRIYIRRNGQGTRATPGGGLSESAGLQKLLRDFGFETVDFGNGEHGVAAQIAMLEGAGLVLSAHGAALTNLAYLNPDLRLIEIFGARRQSACFMHLAAALGFAYYGIFSSACDERHDIVVDLDVLRDAIRALA
jgi:capsular polysaccharide biosynthesis protein